MVMSPAARTQQGAGVQRLPDFRQHGAELVFFRPAAREIRLDRYQRSHIPDDLRYGGTAPVALAAPACFDGVIGTPPSKGIMDLGPIDARRVLLYELRPEIGAAVRKIDAEVPACLRHSAAGAARTWGACGGLDDRLVRDPRRLPAGRAVVSAAEAQARGVIGHFCLHTVFVNLRICY